MNNEIKVMNNDEIRDFCIKKDLKIFELEQELKQKENIIKEVRHYIKDTKQDGYKLVWIDKDNNYFESGIEEILDKAGDER